MAHFSVVSLMNTLDQIVSSDLFPIFHVKDQILSIYRKLRFLQSLLQDSHEEMEILQIQIRDVAYSTQDIIDLHLSQQILSNPKKFMAQLGHVHKNISSVLYYQDLDNEIKKFDALIEELLKDRRGLKYLLPRGRDLRYSLPLGSSIPRRKARRAHAMVGFHEDVKHIKERLTAHQSELQIIPIVGMGGIGKTTLARNVYDDPLIKGYFDIRAWVTVSQAYNVGKVLRDLLQDMRVVIDQLQQNNIQYLMKTLYQSLKNMRYLIVLDDMWSMDAWDSFMRIFPHDNNGSRIMVTTRLSDMANYATNDSSPPHQMNLLDEGESWDLLRQEVFAQEPCPFELEEIGKVIARNCRGLPLATTVVGGLLASSMKTREFWEYVAENVSSVAINNDEDYLDLFSLSYNHLPQHLKPCFLYLGAFPEDHKIYVPKLIKLWVAEGFLQPIKSKGLEEVAEEYLKDLISRNLVFLHQKGSNGKVKYCGVHDLLRDLCIKEARKENFLDVISNKHHPSTNAQHRLSVHLDIVKHDDISDGIYKSALSARSLLCTGYVLSELPFYKRFRLLRVLDLFESCFSKFPGEILNLVNLRYLALSLYSHPVLPPEISQLWKLTVLIVRDHQNVLNQDLFPYLKSYFEVDMPLEILQNVQLRHILVTECFLPDDIDSVVLKNLETLSRVSNFKCTDDALRKFPNLRKLCIYYYCDQIHDWSEYHLEKIVEFSKLENLKCIFNYPPKETLSRNLVFPLTLRKLTLSGSKLSWKEDMRIIGSLPDLEVLKLKNYAFVGKMWEPIEDEFVQLKFLWIEQTNLVEWKAEATHFPCLERLVIRQCRCLTEIPYCVGEIGTLQMIEIDQYSSPSLVDSVNGIVEEQQMMGNDEIQVCFHTYHGLNYELPARFKMDFLKGGADENMIGQISSTTGMTEFFATGKFNLPSFAASLTLEVFEGMRFDFTKGLNQNFSLSHSVMLGRAIEGSSTSSETNITPSAQYEFGANFVDPNLILVGRMLRDGRSSARLKCNLTENLTLTGVAQLSNEPHMSQGMFDFDYKGSDYRCQFQLGSGAITGASYIQSVSPHLSLGGEVYWAGQHRLSGVGYAARYNTDNMIAAGQVDSSGKVALSYIQKVSQKVSLASSFLYNYMSGDVTASCGYDYNLQRCRLRGKIDSNGVVAALLEERIDMGLTFLLSAEIDHQKKDYKFGFGLTVGE
ncbi:hypothetical protein BUALT_Bualt13G0106500 [Buddleja alternifolia]|uniref:NB-ARC domain-containing protein n=1 Tax=Buddleja alternifolia TaxID=168488 RepID=A0AAV6WN49_9LAMI|nr:hypothetical protein BUALT_Bualt13G0106500 [Buddleja alternifolia]